MKLMNQLYLGGTDGMGKLLEYLSSGPAPNALELGGGRGDFALAVLERQIAQNITMVDLSPEAVSIALEKAASKGISQLNALVEDCNSIEIQERYPLILFSQSLHHIEALEHVIAQVYNALEPGGILFINDYIGPSRMQWPDEQIDIMNYYLGLIPEHLRIRVENSGHAGEVKSQIRRIPVELFLSSDPSEAVRSEEIESVVRAQFKKVDFFPMGGTITYELFRGIAHNFIDDEVAASLMKSIIYSEYLMIKDGMASDFGLFICTK